MNKIYVSTKRERHQINKNIYGHFAEHLGRCIYGGFWVGETSEIKNKNGIRLDVVEALKKLNIPVLRWPGGCFADEYHWRDGIGPQETRKHMVNTWWGETVESNHFGTHEFMELCEMLECDAYINGNVGSGSVKEMQEWVEYLTADGASPRAVERRRNGRDKPWKVAYFGVGNENWGCGGHMRPAFYADLYRQFQTYVKDYGDNKIYKIACGSNGADFNWTDVMMKNATPFMDGLSLHHYSLPKPNWTDKGEAIGFPEVEWVSLLESAKKMDELIMKHATIMDIYDPEKRIGMVVDEWGAWYNVEPGTNASFLYQQNTIRDAMVAAITLHIFHKHGDRVTMANIAQTINVLQSMILTKDEKMILTPTYHVFEMFKTHQGGQFLDSVFSNLSDFITSSVSKKGESLTLTLCNYDLKETQNVSYILEDSTFAGKQVVAHILTAEKMDAHNTFKQPDQVQKEIFNDLEIKDCTLRLSIPPMSVIAIIVGN